MAPSGRVPRGVWIAGVVVGVPLAACAGLAWIGKQVADQDDSVGHVASAAEIRARMRRPPATPDQAIVLARERMADGYDPATRLGGCLDGASGYLALVPPTAPEAPEAATLDREIEARMTRAGQREAGVARTSAGRAGAPGGEPAVARPAVAEAMSRDFVGAGFHVGRFTAEGVLGTALVFAHSRCGQGFLQGLTTAPADRAALRALGFTSARCAAGRAGAGASVDLAEGAPGSAAGPSAGR